jgi:hypothetical protein
VTPETAILDLALVKKRRSMEEKERTDRGEAKIGDWEEEWRNFEVR